VKHLRRVLGDPVTSDSPLRSEEPLTSDASGVAKCVAKGSKDGISSIERAFSMVSAAFFFDSARRWP
jgi:hypothetical protein